MKQVSRRRRPHAGQFYCSDYVQGCHIYCPHPSMLSHNFGKISKEIGLDVCLHELWYNLAFLTPASRVHSRMLSEALGHCPVVIALDIYSRVTPGLQGTAIERLA